MSENNNKRIQGKRWCFTINNPDVGELNTINWGVYGNAQLERGSQCGTLHIQGFVIFASNQTLKSVKKVHPFAHWELMKGDLEQNEKYCSKLMNDDGSVAREPETLPHCWGTRPLGRRHSQRLECNLEFDPLRVVTLDLTFLQDEIGGGYCSGINREISPWYQRTNSITDACL